MALDEDRGGALTLTELAGDGEAYDATSNDLLILDGQRQWTSVIRRRENLSSYVVTVLNENTTSHWARG
jgi:hypothetical protein